MREFAEFHHGQTSGNRKVQLTIGVVILVLLAGLGVYAYRLDISAQPHQAVPDTNLPSP
jgi:hypothetical protein